MKRFAAHYAITNAGPVISWPVITTDDEGRIISVEKAEKGKMEIHSTEFHSGILIPGFVNCHCHLELSHLRGKTTRGDGLPSFIESIRTLRDDSRENIIQKAVSADSEMHKNGIVLCADICNTGLTFTLKKKSRIRYINLIEVFGIDPARAHVRIAEAENLSREARDSGLEHYIVPHSAYSVSLTLFRLLREKTSENRFTSMHFMESLHEKQFLEEGSGEMADYYRNSGLLRGDAEKVNDHADAVLNEITRSGNLALVHNTHVDETVIGRLKARDNLYWCLCPGSNMYIEGKLPPVDLLRKHECDIVTGTDSLASNRKLDILEEMKVIQAAFPGTGLPELVRWATFNGARALNKEDEFGSLEPGKKPGLLVMENADAANMRITPESVARRLI